MLHQFCTKRFQLSDIGEIISSTFQHWSTDSTCSISTVQLGFICSVTGRIIDIWCIPRVGSTFFNNYLHCWLLARCTSALFAVSCRIGDFLRQETTFWICGEIKIRLQIGSNRSACYTKNNELCVAVSRWKWNKYIPELSLCGTEFRQNVWKACYWKPEVRRASFLTLLPLFNSNRLCELTVWIEGTEMPSIIHTSVSQFLQQSFRLSVRLSLCFRVRVYVIMRLHSCRHEFPASDIKMREEQWIILTVLCLLYIKKEPLFQMEPQLHALIQNEDRGAESGSTDTCGNSQNPPQRMFGRTFSKVHMIPEGDSNGPHNFCHTSLRNTRVHRLRRFDYSEFVKLNSARNTSAVSHNMTKTPVKDRDFHVFCTFHCSFSSTLGEDRVKHGGCNQQLRR